MKLIIEFMLSVISSLESLRNSSPTCRLISEEISADSSSSGFVGNEQDQKVRRTENGLLRTDPFLHSPSPSCDKVLHIRVIYIRLENYAI